MSNWIKRCIANWEYKELPRMIIMAFDLHPIAESHPKGKFNISFAQKIDSITGKRVSPYPQQMSQNITTSLNFKNEDLTLALGIHLQPVRDTLAAHIYVSDGQQMHAPTTLQWPKRDFRQVPNDIVENVYYIVDKITGRSDEGDWGPDDDSIDPFSPEPNYDLTPAPVRSR